MVRSEERLQASVEWVTAERVRISKRVVTENKTFTVQVRREELVVERFPADETAAGPPEAMDVGGAVGGVSTAPVVELVLHEEVPEVTLRAVPTEWVLVYKDTVAGSTTVDATVRREQIELVEPTSVPHPPE
jgi:uncharacterized protein (TIGR02271 family)